MKSAKASQKPQAPSKAEAAGASRSGRSHGRAIIAIAAALAVLFTFSSSHADSQPPMWVKGRVLVQTRAGLPDRDFDKIIKGHRGKRGGRIPGLNIQVISLPDGVNEQDVAKLLRRNKQIKFAELDQLVPLAETTANDSYYANAWHLAKIQAQGAWDYSRGDSVVVAVLDTGVDPDHPDLMKQLVPGWNVYDNNSDTSDVYGHGTSVAGTIAAVSNNGVGVTSVAWDALIMPVRISQPNGYAYFSTIANGLVWAANNGARVANISYGVSGSSTVQSAARYFQSKGGVVVVAAGNSGVYDTTAASDAMISVSATDSSDSRTSWSSYGAYVDISAPGEAIWTTTNGGGYGAVSGTSFSSPITAGVVALMMAANPSLEPSQITEILLDTADDLGTEGYDVYYGFGRVNALNAVLAAAGKTAPDTEAPVVAIESPVGGTVDGDVTVDVDASDNVGVNKVELYADGSLVATDSAAPYAFSWDSTMVDDGVSTLQACAADAAGNRTCSKEVSVTVDNNPQPVDTTPPTVAITNPRDGSRVSRTVMISAYASDETSLASVQIYIDGSLIASSTTSTVTCSWNSRSVKSGAHTIQAVATDGAGNKATRSIQVIR